MTHSRHIILTCVDRSLAEAGDKLMKMVLGKIVCFFNN